MNILYCGYRDWAKNLYQKISKNFDNHQFYLAQNKEEFVSFYFKNKFDFIFFIGWSWIIPEEIIKDDFCVCLHPSKLPKYRGGTPIQHQILNGETESAVTLFKMDNMIDHGPIIFQKQFSLEGDLNEIFLKIENLGYDGLSYIINNCKNMVMHDQNESEATTFKRRKPEMSEICLEDFSKYTATELYNKIRCLQDPYPNAFIRCKDDTILFFKKASI